MIRGPARGCTNIVSLHLPRSRISGIALAVLALSIAVLALADTRSGLASTGGLVNPGFESGAAPWVISAADVGLVTGTETSAQCATYADMGNLTVAPYKGSKDLRLGGCKRINENENRGLDKASQTFTVKDTTLTFAFRLFSWEHRGYDQFSFDLKSGNTSVGSLSSTLTVPMAGLPGGVATCSGALPCTFNIDVGDRGNFVATNWIPVTINIPAQYMGQTLTLSYSVLGGKDNAHATWAYFDANTPPVARFSHDTIDVREGDVVQFTDTSFDPDGDKIVAWSWQINGQSSNEQNPVFIFPDEGTYSACLTVTDASGDSNRVCSGAAATDGTQVAVMTVNNTAPQVNALNLETLSGQPASLFGRVLDPGWTDTLSASWQVNGQPVPATIQNDNLAFLSTGVITGTATTTSNVSGTLTLQDGDGGTGSDNFNVTVVPNDPQRFEPADNSLATAPVMTSDATHLSWIQAAGDKDFFEVRLPDQSTLPAGGEVLVTLKGPGTSGLNADYDLVILSQLPTGVTGFRSGDAGQTNVSTSGFRSGGFRSGGFRSGGFRSGGFRSGGFRSGGFRSGGFRSGSAVYPLSQTGFNGLEGDTIGSADITLDELGLGALPGTVSVAAYSGNHGTKPEVALAQSDVNGTKFYVGVIGANGAFSNTQPYSLQIETSVPLDPILALGAAVCTKSPLVGSGSATSSVVDLNPGFPAAGQAKTLIVTQRERMIALYDDPATTSTNEGLTAWNALLPKLQALAQQPSVSADIISMPSVFYDDADSNPCSVDATNALAAAIRGQVQSRLSANPTIQYVVLAGDDDIVPQRRVPDQTIIGNEANYVTDSLLKPGSPLLSSLLGGYILTDDYYVDAQPTAWQGRELYVPDMPIGRLVETPAEIGAAADAFVASSGVLDYSTASTSSGLVTGYDFFKDGADAIAAGLGAKLNVKTLINDTWSADDLRCRLLGQAAGSLTGCSTPSVSAPMAHFLHYAALSANGFGTNNFGDIVNGSQVAAAGGATPALQRKVVFTIGCHGGFNVPDRASQPADGGLGIDPSLDFAQAMARQRAVFIASTGYGLGDDQGLGGHELLLRNFSQEVVKGDVFIGNALTKAKSGYLLSLLSMTPYDEKTSIETTMFGLPMYQVKVPAGTGSVQTLQPQTAQENFTLTVNDGGVATTTTYPIEDVTTAQGHYLKAAGDTQVTPFRAIEPRVVIPLPPGNPAQGVVIKSGSYTDVSGFDPVISLPTQDWLLDQSEPQTCLNAFWPAVPATINTLDSGGAQSLVITPGQFRCTSGTAATVSGIQRKYTSLTLDILHSNPADTQPPAVPDVTFTSGANSSVDVAVTANDPSGIARIVVLKYSGGTMTSTELALPQPLPASGTFTLHVPNVAATDDLAGEVIDGADNVAYFTAKGSGGFTPLSVNAGPDLYVTPGTPTSFQVSVPDFASLKEPFYTVQFGDGTSTSGPVPGAYFSVPHTYTAATDFPVTATVKVMDADGRLGSDTVVVRLLCDPIGDAFTPNTDFVSCDVSNTASTITIAVRVVGTIATDTQYRLNLKTSSFNGQVKYDNGKAGGALTSLVVTFGDASELRFTFSRAEVGLSSGGQLQWSAESQKGQPGQPGQGILDDMPNSGFFTAVIS
ncbi:MAG: PKD domain-containing protein [Chloroflexi bacterium]|nr:MAG: PKD domain-containing protein [Chloroflexota bacterium]